MTIADIQTRIVNEFNTFDSWVDKYGYLISLAKKLPPMDAKHKIEDNLVRGCQSKVWLFIENHDGKLVMHADSDGAITKGIITLLWRCFSNQNPNDIIHSIDDHFFMIKDIGLDKHLSSIRSNGLSAMIKTIYKKAKQGN